jgi:hypothetical protein
MQAGGMKLGLGVEEDSAAVLRGDQVEVLGEGGALLVDLADATTDPTLGVFNIANARLTYLGHGDRYDLRTRALSPAKAKLEGQLIDPRAADFKPYNEDAPYALDVLAAGVVLQSMIRIVDGTTEAGSPTRVGGDRATQPRLRVRFSHSADAGLEMTRWQCDANTLASLRLDRRPGARRTAVVRPVARCTTASGHRLNTTLAPLRITCVYSCVVLTSMWPSNSCTVRMS